MIWRGNPHIEKHLIPMDGLIPNEREYQDKPTLFADIQKNGQQSPIVVDENVIKDGNNRFKILKVLGFTHISARSEF